MYYPTGKFNARLNGNKTGNYAIAAGSWQLLFINLSNIHWKLILEPVLLYCMETAIVISIIFWWTGRTEEYLYGSFQFHQYSEQGKTDTEIFYGRIDENKLAALRETGSVANISMISIYADRQLIFTAAEYLQRIGINKDNIHFELFTHWPKTSNNSNPGRTERCRPEEPGPVKLDGRSIDFWIGFQSSSILDAALKTDADLPFCMQGGVCATCRAKLVEGKSWYGCELCAGKRRAWTRLYSYMPVAPKNRKVVVDFDIK